MLVSGSVYIESTNQNQYTVLNKLMYGTFRGPVLCTSIKLINYTSPSYAIQSNGRFIPCYSTINSNGPPEVELMHYTVFDKNL